MLRLLLSCLLITSLLACPLRCLAAGSEDCASAEPKDSRCSCCHHQCDPADNEGRSESPRDDCSCPNCICEGATLQAAPRLVAVIIVDSFDGAEDAACKGSQLGAVLTQRAFGSGPPGISGGRDALIAHQLWRV